MMVGVQRKKNLGEPDAHAMMRRGKVILRLLLILAVAATILLIVFHRSVAYLAAMPVPALLLVYAVVSYLERRSRADILRVPNQAAISQDEIEMDVQYAGIFIALEFAILFVLSAFVMAATMVDDWSMVGPATAVLLLLMMLITLPYLPLFIIDSSSDEREKLLRESTSTPKKSEGNEKRATRG
jgi:hypothetical protein